MHKISVILIEIVFWRTCVRQPNARKWGGVLNDTRKMLSVRDKVICIECIIKSVNNDDFEIPSGIEDILLRLKKFV